MDHDHNFKNLILDYARQALEFFAPDEALDLERARITPLRQEQLKERLGERFRELDVPLLVEWPDGRREAVVFVLEEETTAGRFNIHRLVHYCADIAELLGTDRVVPVVIFLGRAGSAPRELHLGGERHTYLSFRYLACSLADLPAERYFDSDNLVCRLNLPNMAHTPAQRLEVYARALRGLFTLERDPDRQAKYLDFLDIYTALDDTEQAQFRARYPDEVDTVSSFAQRFTEQGIQQGVRQGIQQGLEQGQKQGEAAILLRLLARKFGPAAAEAHRPRIEAADAETLLTWSERILDAETPTLSANMPETPAPLSITVGRLKGRTHGRSEQTDDAREYSRHGGAAPGPGGRGQAEAAPVQRGVPAAHPRGGRALHRAG